MKNRLPLFLRSVHQRQQRFNLLKGLAALLALGIPVFLACFAIDWMIRVAMPGRFILLALLLGVSLRWAWCSGWRHLRSFSLTRCALQVEDHCKGMDSLLVSSVQFDQVREASGTSVDLEALTIARADEAVVPLKTAEVVPFKSLKKPSAQAALGAVVLMAVALINTPLLSAGLARIFTPWQDVSYPTRTQIDLDQGDRVVREGGGLQIGARLGGEVPESARLSLRTGQGRPREHPLDVVDGACGYRIPAVFRGFEYALMAGDAKTDWHTVTVIPAPRVTGSRIRLVYPDYMQRAPEVMEAMSLTVPEGVHITWELQLDRPVRKAAFKVDGGVPVASKVSEDGLTVTHSTTADASGAYAFAWTEKDHGFKFDSTTYYLQVAPDQPPQVELARPARNLFATVGRELVLACRVQDDHGIGAAQVIYRQNNTDEQVVPLSLQATAGRSTRELDWDYRDSVTDLSIGDSVTFTLEVSDRYPNGPHRARSESRRVTFLSEEDYLEKINEQITRLLSRTRSIYRQERSAHVSLGELDPLGDAFRQRCFLESARQDMLRETIELLCTGLEEVIDDLRANGIEDETQFQKIGMFQAGLRSISREQLTKAAVQLRDLGAAHDGSAEGLSQAAATVNHAARELGKLVVHLGVAQTLEVMAMELHVIGGMQNELRIEAMEATREAGDLSLEQEALAGWLDQLLVALESGVDYADGPLKAIRLSRRIKDLRSAGIGKAMAQAAGRLKDGQGRQAIDQQDAIVTKLLRLECAARSGAEHEALRRAHDLLAGAVDTLVPAAGSEDTPADPPAERLDGLRRKLQRLLLPDIPAPVSDLLSEAPPKIPPVETLTASGRQALADAIRLFQAGNQPEARAQQAQAAEAFGALLTIVRARLDEVTRADRYVGRAARAMDHASRIGELLTGQMSLTERTEDAPAGENGGAQLAAAQERLGKETLRIHERIGGEQGGTESPGRFVQPVRKLLKEAADAMVKAHAALQAKEPDPSIAFQDMAVDALRNAIDLSNQEVTGWTRVVNMIWNADATGVPAGYMADIAAEQHDFAEVTTRRPPLEQQQLLKVQVNLLIAMRKAANLTGGIGSSPDFDAHFTAAESGMTGSLQQLFEGTISGAADAQVQAAGSLRSLAGKLEDAIERFDYFTKVLEFLRARHSEGVAILSRLDGLDAALAEQADPALPALVKTAEALGRDARDFGAQMVRATGRADYADAQAPLAGAVAALNAGDRDACGKAIFAARESLEESLAELLDLGARIDYVRMLRSDQFLRPGASQPPPECWVMLDMITLLHRQQDLAHVLSSGDAAKGSDLIPRMHTLRETAAGLVQSSGNHRLVTEAHARLIEAIDQVDKASPREAAAELHASNTLLRHGILEYAREFISKRESGAAMLDEEGTSTDVFDLRLSDMMLEAFDKDWGGVEGEERKAGRTEWEVLGRRARAALNENFVRELPLEYREFLKDYYERLTE